jgi:hypothetical protein
MNVRVGHFQADHRDADARAGHHRLDLARYFFGERKDAPS